MPRGKRGKDRVGETPPAVQLAETAMVCAQGAPSPEARTPESFGNADGFMLSVQPGPKVAALAKDSIAQWSGPEAAVRSAAISSHYRCLLSAPFVPHAGRCVCLDRRVRAPLKVH